LPACAREAPRAGDAGRAGDLSAAGLGGFYSSL
jgi:hypothetical protein